MEIQGLLQKKHSCYNRLLTSPDDSAAKATYGEARSTLQTNLRVIQNNWWTALAERTQMHAEMGDIKLF